MAEDPISRTMRYLNNWENIFNSVSSSGARIEVFTEARRNDPNHERDAAALYLVATGRFNFPISAVYEGFKHERYHNREATRQYGDNILVSYGVTFQPEKNRPLKLGLRAKRYFINSRSDPKKEAIISLAPKDPSDFDIKYAKSCASQK